MRATNLSQWATSKGTEHVPVVEDTIIDEGGGISHEPGGDVVKSFSMHSTKPAPGEFAVAPVRLQPKDTHGRDQFAMSRICRGDFIGG